MHCSTKRICLHQKKFDKVPHRAPQKPYGIAAFGQKMGELKMRFNRREIIQGASSVGIVGAANIGGLNYVYSQDNHLIINIWGGRWERFWREYIVPPFQQKTGTRVTVDVGLSVNFAANLRATGKDNPQYSYLQLNELVGSLVRAEGYIEQWPESKVPNLKNISPAAFIDEGRGVTIGISPVGISYRKDLVNTPPANWTDLWENPEFSGKLALFNITNTVGYMFLMASSRIFGSGPFDFEAGFAAIEKLKPFRQADLASEMAVLLTRGEAVAGPLDIGEVATLQSRGAPLGFAAPTEELFAFDQSFYLIKNGPNQDAACAFLDFMLSEEIQEKLAQEFSLVPANTLVDVSSSVAEQLPEAARDLANVAKFDWVKANQERDRAAEMWNRILR